MVNILSTVIFIIIVFILLSYIFFLKKQIRNMDSQVGIRLKEKSRQPITMQLLDKDLTSLCADFNRILEAEEKLRIEAVRHQEKTKNMIADISHDLRTPLTAVKGYIQLIERECGHGREKKMIATALNHINELEQLINNFFELSYLEIESPQIKYSRINITNMVGNTIADYIYQFEERNICVEFETEKPLYICADEEKTKRIIQNLIKNCIAHSEGDVCIEITDENDYIELSFKNPVDCRNEINAENIFERFYNADKSRNKSTGLGLSIVKILAQQMEGKAAACINDDILEIKIGFKKAA